MYLAMKKKSYLPGITKVHVGDIEAHVRTMILSHIQHETCIILALLLANVALALPPLGLKS
jgi:hypothetical protein